MKKLSIRLKLTLWFILFMLLLAGILLGFVFFVLNSETRRHLENTLVSRVSENAREVGYEDGQLAVSSRFIPYRNGLYCLAYDKEGALKAGRPPEEGLEALPLKDGRIRRISENGENYLLYDLKLSDKRRTIWLRGISSESGRVPEAASLFNAILFSIPLLTLLAAAGGYLLAGRSLKPIASISKTAEEIGLSGDLSRRIDVEETGDELHRLAGTFNRMFDQLEKSFAAEKQFTADASHELRTPISIILAQCEYAIENARGEEELYEAIGAIQKQGYRMSRLVEALLSFARLDQQTETAAAQTVDLSALAEEVCLEQAALSEKNITLSRALQPGITMQGDPSLLTRMLENLIRNAFRYGKENGQIIVSLKQADKEILLTIADDGIGIAEEDLPRIWDRFYRADRSRTYREGGGLGLGLSMVKQIVSLHHGSITAESRPGEGSSFSVRFPGEGLSPAVHPEAL